MNPLARMSTSLRVKGKKGEAFAEVLFDTGASRSFVRREIAEKLSTIEQMKDPLKFSLGDGRLLHINEDAELELNIGALKVSDRFNVLDACIEDVVLGESTMRKCGLKIDMEHGSVFAEIKIVEDEKEKEKFSMNEFLKKLFGALNIKADAEKMEEDAAVELIAAKVNPPKKEEPPRYTAPQGVLALLDLPEDATEDQVKGKILAIKHPGNKVPTEQYNALQQEILRRNTSEAITQALMDGKLQPSEVKWAKELAENDLGTFYAFIANRPKVVPIDDRLPKQSSNKVVIDEEQAAINAQLKVDNDTFLKYGAR